MFYWHRGDVSAFGEPWPSCAKVELFLLLLRVSLLDCADCMARGRCRCFDALSPTSNFHCWIHCLPLYRDLVRLRSEMHSASPSPLLCNVYSPEWVQPPHVRWSCLPGSWAAIQSRYHPRCDQAMDQIFQIAHHRCPNQSFRGDNDIHHDCGKRLGIVRPSCGEKT